MTTSDLAISFSTTSLPCGLFRSTARLRQLRFADRKKTLVSSTYRFAPDQWRSYAPVMGSILTTSAPRSAKYWTAAGPCRKWHRLTILTPVNGSVWLEAVALFGDAVVVSGIRASFGAIRTCGSLCENVYINGSCRSAGRQLNR